MEIRVIKVGKHLNKALQDQKEKAEIEIERRTGFHIDIPLKTVGDFIGFKYNKRLLGTLSYDEAVALMNKRLRKRRR